MKIGVIAGTPVDTRMGADYVGRHGHEVLSRACSPSPDEQMRMQKLYPKKLTERVVLLCEELLAEGAEGIYVNCNSMSAAVDLSYIGARLPTRRFVTPFDVYRECARKYDRVAILAANGQSLAAIERVLAEGNPGCTTFGAGLPPLVNAVESQWDPARIVRCCGLRELLGSFRKMGCEALLLGCTHFPYLKGELAEMFSLPIIDPNARMLELLTRPGGPEADPRGDAEGGGRTG